jgi:hypothetical protein
MADHGDRTTRPTTAGVGSFLDGVAHERRRADAWEVLEVMRRVTGAEPTMWGASIIGFGRQPYTTSDGKERDWFAVGLSPRKAALTLYGLTYYGSNDDLLQRLGKHTSGKGCMYVKQLDDIDRDVLEELIAHAWQPATSRTPRPERWLRCCCCTQDACMASITIRDVPDDVRDELAARARMSDARSRNICVCNSCGWPAAPLRRHHPSSRIARTR